MLDTSSVLRWTHIVLCGRVYCTSVYALHVTLDTSTILRYVHFMLRWTDTSTVFFGVRTLCHVGHVYFTLMCTSCYVDTSTVPGCANFRDADVCDMFASWSEEKRSAGAVLILKTIPKTVTFSEGVQHALFNSHCFSSQDFLVPMELQYQRTSK